LFRSLAGLQALDSVDFDVEAHDVIADLHGAHRQWQADVALTEDGDLLLSGAHDAPFCLAGRGPLVDCPRSSGRRTLECHLAVVASEKRRFTKPRSWSVSKGLVR